MIQELEHDQTYYLDLIDDTLAITAIHILRFQNEEYTDDDKAMPEGRIYSSVCSRISYIQECFNEEDDLNLTLKHTNLKSEFKIVILGDAQVGKSALVARLLDDDAFVKKYQPTLSDQFKQQMFMLDAEGSRTREITMNIKDIGHKFINYEALID